MSVMRFAALFALIFLLPLFAHASAVVNEIMYDPEGSDTGREWVEIYNNGSEPVTIISGSSNNAWRFYEVHSSGPHNHTFSVEAYQGTLTLNPEKYALVVQNGDAFKTNYPSYMGTIIISSAFSLANTSQTIGLRIGPSGSIWSEVTYDADVMGGKGDGKSLQLISGSWIAAVPTPGVANGGGSDSPDSNSAPPDTSSDATNTPATVQLSGGAPPEYIPIPTLRIITNGDRTVSSGADTPFTAVVYDGKGNKRDDALILWSFGDGMQRTGASVYHSYYYPGEYIAVVHVSTSDDGDELKEMIITVKDASIKIASVSARGISLANDSSRTLDLSLWRLSMGGKEFKIPAGTQILAGRTILFPSQIIQLPIADSGSLLYPSGDVATTYPQAPKEQPQALQASFNNVQTADPIISTNKNVQAYDEEVRAPAPATELAAAGAALPATPKKQGGIFSSPWFYSLLGVVALAGTAFIFI